MTDEIEGLDEIIALPYDIKIDEVRELTESDMALYRAAGPSRASAQVQRVSDTHHAIARLLALGMRPVEISRRLRVTQSSISILQHSPAFQELLEGYREKAENRAQDVAERLDLLTHTVLSEFATRLEENPDDISSEVLRRTIGDLLDRTGFAAVRKSISASLSLGVSSEELARVKAEARASLEALRPKAIPEGASAVIDISAESRPKVSEESPPTPDRAA